LHTVVRFVFLPCPWKYQWQSEQLAIEFTA